MKYSQWYLTTLITIGVAGLVIADGAQVTHQFQGGSPASAIQVNQNFQELANRIDAVPASHIFDYRDYQSSASSKTFATVGLCGDTETRSFNRVDNGNNTTTVTMTRVRQASGINCQHHTFTYLATTTDYWMTGKKNNDNTGVTLNTDTFNEGVLRLMASMRLGTPFASHSTITNDVAGDVGGFIETVTVLAVENVTVPLGTYQNCLKVHTLRTSNGTGSFNRLSWLCPAMGEVKRVQHELDTNLYRRWELTSMVN